MPLVTKLPFGWRWKDVAGFLGMAALNLTMSVAATDNWISAAIGFAYLMTGFTISYLFVRRRGRRKKAERAEAVRRDGER